MNPGVENKGEMHSLSPISTESSQKDNKFKLTNSMISQFKTPFNNLPKAGKFGVGVAALIASPILAPIAGLALGFTFLRDCYDKTKKHKITKFSNLDANKSETTKIAKNVLFGKDGVVESFKNEVSGNLNLARSYLSIYDPNNERVIKYSHQLDEMKNTLQHETDKEGLALKLSSNILEIKNMIDEDKAGGSWNNTLALDLEAVLKEINRELQKIQAPQSEQTSQAESVITPQKPDRSVPSALAPSRVKVTPGIKGVKFSLSVLGGSAVTKE